MACTLFIVLSYWKLQKEKKWSDQLRSIAVTGVFWNHLLSFNMQCSFPHQEWQDLTRSFAPFRLPFSSFVTVSLGLLGSRGRLLELQCKPRELHLSCLPLGLSFGILTPRSIPPWCLSPPQQHQSPCLHPPPPQHSHSITSQYVPQSCHYIS